MAKSKSKLPVVPCPAWLEELAVIEWNRLVADGVVVPTVENLTHLAGYCQSFGRWRAAEEHLTKNGVDITVVDENDNIKFSGPSPYVAISMKYFDRMLKTALVLGINTDRPGMSKATQPVRPEKTPTKSFFGAFPTLN